MSEKCAHCGAVLASGQPVCPECGNTTGGAAAPRARRPSSSQGTPLPAAPRDKQKDFALVGKVIAGKYKVLEVLGQGGFGTVYRVEITAGMVGEQLALKILPKELSSHPAFRSQFLNEIRVAMRLVDRAIAQIRDVGVTEEDLLYYTMDLCPGVTLKQLLSTEKKLPIARSILIVLNVLRGLQTAHASGIIHRDLKPANIMVQSQGGKDTVRILDFGIATAIESTRDRSRGFVGSPHYMPPEQFMGEQLGFYTDLYSLGVILYECITGEKPYPGSSAQEVFQGIKARAAPPLNTRAPEAAKLPGLVELVGRALEKNPTKRFQSARELFDALHAVLTRSTTPGAAAPAPPQAPPPAEPPLTPEAAKAFAERIRRRKSGQLSRSPGSYAGPVALATFVLGSVFAGIFFHREIATWWRSLDGRTQGPAVDGKQAPQPPATAKDATRAGPLPAEDPAKAATPSKGSEKGIAEEKAAAVADLQARVDRLLGDAARALEAKDATLAREKAQSALSLDPRSCEAHRLHGIAALRLLDFKAAAASLESARGLLGENAGNMARVSILVGLAEARLEGSPPAPPEAEALAKEALGASPKSPEVLAVLARALEAQGKRDEVKKVIKAARAGGVASAALEQIEKRLQAEDAGKAAQEAAALLKEARTAFESSDHEKARELAGKSRSVLPSEEAYRIEADSLLELEQPAGAAALLEQALGTGSKEGSGNPLLSDAAAFEGRLWLARGLAATAASQGPPAEEALLETAKTFEKARAKLLEAKTPAASERARRKAGLALAAAHAERGDRASTEAALQDALKSEDPSLLTEAARVLTRLGDRDREEENRKRALAGVDPIIQRVLKQGSARQEVLAAANFLQGLASLRLGDLEASEARYTQALSSFAAARKAGLNTRDLFEAWANAYDRTGNLMRAAQLFRSAYEVAPSPEACLKAVEYFLLANPDGPEALDLLKEAKARFRNDPAIEQKLKEVSE